MKMTKVTDLYLNAYLLAKGFEMKDIDVIELDGRETVFFVYENEEDLVAAIEEYRDDKFIKDFVSKYLFSKRQITAALDEFRK